MKDVRTRIRGGRRLMVPSDFRMLRSFRERAGSDDKSMRDLCRPEGVSQWWSLAHNSQVLDAKIVTAKKCVQRVCARVLGQRFREASRTNSRQQFRHHLSLDVDRKSTRLNSSHIPL